MKVTFYSIILAVVIGFAAPAQAIVMDYFANPIEDAMVDSEEAGINFGGDVELAVQGYAEVPPIYSLGSIERTYLKFDLSEIPDGAEIISAEFGIYLTERNQGGASTVDPHVALYLVSDDTWEETSIIWSSRPDYEAGYVDDEVPMGDTGVYYTWNLLSDLGENSWTGYAADLADDKLSLVLITPDEEWNNVAKFNSSEAASDQPYLSIAYVPEPTTIILLGVGGLLLRRRK